MHDLSAWQRFVSSVCQLSCNVSAQLKARCLSVSLGHDTWDDTWAALSAMAAQCQLRCIQPASKLWSSCTRLEPLQCVSPALTCQLSCNLTAALQTVDLAICLLWLRSAELQFFRLAATLPVNFRLSAQVHTFQPCCSLFQAVCNQLARLQSVSTAAQCQLLCSSACIMSVQQQSVSSAVFCQLSCNPSALAYSVMQFICCDKPAARHQI